jgi:hypothetical protein
MPADEDAMLARLERASNPPKPEPKLEPDAQRKKEIEDKLDAQMVSTTATASCVDLSL